MDTIQANRSWNEAHQSKFFALLRFTLGIIILVRGIIFIGDTDAIVTMLANSKISFLSVMLAHYVALAHLLGGLLIAIGLITRAAVIFQLPILLGAILFVNMEKGFFSMHSELGFSILVFALLLFFLFYGSGPLSVDKFMKKHKNV